MRRRRSVGAAACGLFLALAVSWGLPSVSVAATGPLAGSPSSSLSGSSSSGSLAARTLTPARTPTAATGFPTLRSDLAPSSARSASSGPSSGSLSASRWSSSRLPGLSLDHSPTCHPYTLDGLPAGHELYATQTPDYVGTNVHVPTTDAGGGSYTADLSDTGPLTAGHWYLWFQVMEGEVGGPPQPLGQLDLTAGTPWECSALTSWSGPDPEPSPTPTPEPTPDPCGSTAKPCIVQPDTEFQSLVLAGFGLLVVLTSALLVSAWGRD